jgi:hypothetical protein
MMTRRHAIAAGAAITVPGICGAKTMSAPSAPLLGPIRAVTTTAADLAAVQAAYETVLGYRVVEHGTVSPETAVGWGAPKVAGRKVLIMRPASGEPTFLRFVEQAQPAGFRPMTTFGWNATEIIVQDCDALAERLKGTAFRLVAPPRPLGSSPEIRAMQAIGPANEMLYLTAVTSPLPASRDMPAAEAFVGRCFIAVMGGASIPQMADFYQETFGNRTTQPFNARILSLSIQNDLPPDTHYDLAVTQLGGGTKLELDAYPAGAAARPRPAGGLPCGMAIVSFDCTDLDRFATRLVAPASTARGGPFKGRRTGVMAGAAGELIELVEA